MRKTDIEYWALSVIERVEKGQPVEDSRVELKADWIDSTKAARRIAGHANASHGEPILWLIGVDEKQGAKGVDYNDFAAWFSAVKSQFEGLVPDSTSVNVPYKSLTVSAIIFETDRAPYVIKNPSGGSIQFEVPWRDGTAIRTANRMELLQMLVPLQKLPSIEVLGGVLSAQHESRDGVWHWNLELQLYVSSMLQAPLAIPFHKCVGTLELNQYLATTPFIELRLRPPALWSGFRYVTSDTPRPQFDSLTIDGTESELIIQGPGKFQLIATATSTPIESDISSTVASINVSLRPVDSDLAIHIKTDMAWDSKGLKPEYQLQGQWRVG